VRDDPGRLVKDHADFTALAHDVTARRAVS